MKAAKGATGRLATLSTAVKNQALLAMADGLEAQAELLAANEKRSPSNSIPPRESSVGRPASPDGGCIRDMAAGLRDIARLAGPARRDAQDVDAPETGCRLDGCEFLSASSGSFMKHAKRHGRLRRVVSEIGQRLSPARRVRSAAFQYIAIAKVLSESAEKPVCRRRSPC